MKENSHVVKYCTKQKSRSKVVFLLWYVRSCRIYVAITIDAEMVKMISTVWTKMVAEYKMVQRIVYGVRDNRDTDSAFTESQLKDFIR